MSLLYLSVGSCHQPGAETGHVVTSWKCFHHIYNLEQFWFVDKLLDFVTL